MDNSKDLVNKAIEFNSPSRIPLAKGVDTDIVTVESKSPVGFTVEADIDEWGCQWESYNPGCGDQGQVVAHPLKN